MSEGGHKNEYTYPRPEDDDLEWWAENRYNIRDVRSLYSSIEYYQSIWPGSPERPEGEKEFLDGFKTKLFSMITDYNYVHHKVDISDRSAQEKMDDATPSGEDS